MRKNSLYVLISLLAVSFAFASCLDSNNTDYTLTSDVAISSFSIGSIAMPDTLKNSQGNDSIVYDSVIGSDYKFTIDQQNNLIYNRDSLPVGTNVSKVTTSLNMTYGYAVTYVKNGQDTIWSSSDSIDFTSPVTFKAYALNGAIRQYQVKINVHKLDPDSLQWNLMNSSDLRLPENARHKAVYKAGRMFIFAETSDGTVEMTSSADGLTWSELQPVELEGVDYTSALALDDRLYILADKKLYTSSEGTTWTQTSFTESFDKLFAASPLKGELYAQSGTELLSLSVYDQTVTSAGSAANGYFPVQSISYSTSRTSTNQNIEQLVLLGTRESTLENDTTAMVWVKLSNETAWTHYPQASNNTMGCPKLEGLASFSYDGKLYAFGGDYDIPSGQTRPTGFRPFKYLYESMDGGISWQAKTEKVMLPAAFLDRTASFSYLVDEDDFIWIFWTPSEQTQGITEVWRGKINRLGF